MLRQIPKYLETQQEKNCSEMKKNILITGASSGIGAYASEYLANQNYRVIICGRNADRLMEIKNNTNNKETIIKSVDLSCDENVKEFYKELKNLDIKLDAIICCAGSHIVKPIRISKSQDYIDLFKSNFLTASNIITNMQKLLNQSSSIVLLSSAATKKSAAAVSAYVSAKSALDGLLKSSAIEFAPKKIRVNMISPGVVETEMTKRFLNSIGEQAAEEVRKGHPLGLGQSKDVCELIEFLISDKSSWITGQEIVIDGGFSIN